ncbi:phosphoribosyl-ATP diphosphatase [Vitreoscilla massiliensis]|uniref:Phosphoribosyl-ATP pyrophosphatase n=1 Tax=Vitreoscilla massiliensis TaxID=1689272 RepID=A0ABY4E2C6_9NEIS|nr:phosphoribosyl-ATP diphosphatase [Vitreoscilla massiliensis]UOO89911.1 phosphoribosyl-ATP diphosphatase [Vitreoscilla massiliensis]
MQNYEVLKEISDVIEVRKQAAAESSYVSQLMHKGEDAILKKVIEEAGEVLMASKDGDKLHIIKEVADVWFHSMVLLGYHGLRAEDVLMELQRRQNISGIDEKASRAK